MNTIRGTVWLSYVLVALVVAANVNSILFRAHDPIWPRMPDILRIYDLYSICIAVLGVVVAYGLWRRREWGRIFGIGFAVLALFLFVGIRLLQPVITSGAVPITLGWDAAIMGTLSIASIVTLSRRAFRDH